MLIGVSLAHFRVGFSLNNVFCLVHSNLKMDSFFYCFFHLRRLRCLYPADHFLLLSQFVHKKAHMNIERCFISHVNTNNLDLLFWSDTNRWGGNLFQSWSDAYMSLQPSELDGLFQIYSLFRANFLSTVLRQTWTFVNFGLKNEGCRTEASWWELICNTLNLKHDRGMQFLGCE